MAPTGDFVVLEAKELVKHFTDEGLPKNTENCQVLRPTNKKSVKSMDINDLKKENQNWMDLFLTEYHDVYYNKTDTNEKAGQWIFKNILSNFKCNCFLKTYDTNELKNKFLLLLFLDAVSAKVQQIYIGSRETASTCHGLNSERTVVQKSNASTNISKIVVPAKSEINEKQSNRRRTPRKIKPISVPEIKARQQPLKESLKDPQSVFRQVSRVSFYVKST